MKIGRVISDGGCNGSIKRDGFGNHTGVQTHKIDGKMLDWLLFCEKVLYNNIQDGVIVLLGIEELGRADGGNEFSNIP